MARSVLARKWLAFLSLLVLAVFGAVQGRYQQSRLSAELERLCDDLEDSSQILSSSQKTLQQSAVALRRIAQEIDMVHKKVTDDAIFKSGIAVGGDLIRLGGVVLDVFMMGTPIFTAVGLTISSLGGYLREASQSKEEESNSYYRSLAKEIFSESQQNLKDVSDMYRRIEQQFQRLEAEERLSGTILQKKLLEMKISFPHLHAWRDEMRSSDTHDGRSRYKYDVAYKAISAVAANMGAPSKVLHVAEAFSAILSLIQDGNQMYNDIKHRNEGARSELAEYLRMMAKYLEDASRGLHRVLNKDRSEQKLLE